MPEQAIAPKAPENLSYVPPKAVSDVLPPETAKKVRTRAEIVVAEIRRCRDDEMPEVAKELVKQSPGLALTLSTELDRSMFRPTKYKRIEIHGLSDEPLAGTAPAT